MSTLRYAKKGFADHLSLKGLELAARQVRESLADPSSPLHAKFHRNPNPSNMPSGGWVENTAQIGAGSYVGPDALVFGLGTVLEAGTSVEGLSVVGPYVHAKGKSVISNSHIWGNKNDPDHLSTVQNSAVFNCHYSPVHVRDGILQDMGKAPTPSRLEHLLDGLRHSFSRTKKGAEAAQAGREAAK